MILVTEVIVRVLLIDSLLSFGFIGEAKTMLEPRSGELRAQKLKSHLVKTQGLNVLPLKPGIGQYIAIRAVLTARNFFLLIFTLPVHLPAFFPKPLLIFSRVGCVRPAG